jgi:hypothetical protein
MADDGSGYRSFISINKNGTFFSNPMLEPALHGYGNYKEQSKKTGHTGALLEDILLERVAPDQFGHYLNRHDIVKMPGHSVRNVAEGKNKFVYSVEPDRGYLDSNRSSGGFSVMTDFSAADYLSFPFGEGRDADEHYKTTCQMLAVRTEVDADDAFYVLKKTSRDSGAFPTILSLVFLPEKGVIYFSLYADFDKRYRFSFTDNMVRAFSGFSQEHELPLTRAGVHPNTLHKWI